MSHSSQVGLAPRSVTSPLTLLRARVAAAEPTRIALRDEHAWTSYGRLAAQLDAASTEPPDPPPVLVRVGSSTSGVLRLLRAAATGTSVLVVDDQATDWELARARAALETHVPPPHAAPALHLCSSGTGGRAKVVALGWEDVLGNANDLGRALGYTAADRVWVTTPPSHLYGLGAGVLAGLLHGATVDLRRGLMGPGELGDHLSSSGTTVLLSVPFLLRRYLRELRGDPKLVARLRLRAAVGAGEPVDDALVGAWRQATGGVPLLVHYGLTEAGHVTLATGAGGEGVGRPLPGVEVRVDGREVVVRRTPPATPYDVLGADRDGDGWCRTGDTGTIDHEGRLHVTGRLDDRVNVAGNKVDPAEVERALRRCPGVHEAVVFGAPGPAGEAVVMSFVVAGPGIDEAGVRASLSARLSAHKVPRRVVVVDRLPRTRTGKVRRDLLLARLGQDPGALPPAGS